MAGRNQRVLLIAGWVLAAGLASQVVHASGGTTGSGDAPSASAPASAPASEDARALWLADEAFPTAEVERREVRLNDIDTENVEVGPYYGVLSVEDFGASAVEGLSVAWHVSEDFFLEGVVARTRLGTTSYERLSGAAELLSEDERDLAYYGLTLGVNVLPGEVFLGRSRAMNSGLFLLGGVGATDFAGEPRFTMSVGMGYRVIATDWLALRFDVRDHMFESDVLGESRDTHNIEVRTGITVFF